MTLGHGFLAKHAVTVEERKFAAGMVHVLDVVAANAFTYSHNAGLQDRISKATIQTDSTFDSSHITQSLLSWTFNTIEFLT